ncbi:ketopantoate reductase PanE/ApbA-domain-containing protein [Aspergillus pseudotamarii]|uniref:Ketopantoate reductase PanE/ApbA-domain-containing protein n=1 Tax=Aspergillus pseudotamarii TaxID=132259 RepID=A0A5N6SA02_ASPPS|nr:ketopantoate reductase PanE/ApbA-domain-containing protein [Aspergillus pseudotamarii]KAE8131548.1 ketopantoate reductase PanE/ApbA-domain-containing protein [Aspergillus pseudotamarii]
MGRHLTRLCLVGSNAISAFLSWRLQATTSCDVTLVWKSGYESVSQYGVSFKSKAFGNERFKPRHVVRTPEDAASRENAFDYVILCVKALPDVYDLASVIESVVTPQHTCILVNTTNTLGVESHLEQRFPTNVVLSLVSGVEISQIGASEFEHLNSSEIWVGATSKQTSIPSTIQNDMAAALAMTLASGQVDCKVSDNIRQEQFDRMIGPIAFYPTSVMFETSNHTQLLEKVGVRQLVSDIIEELLELARANGCSFPNDFAKKTIETMTANGAPSTMYQDFQARRPMEIETYLGSPIKLATESGVRIPRIETLYAVLHHVNATNLSKPRTNESPPPVLAQPPPRMSSAPPRGPMNGPMRGGRAPSGMMPRRGPPPHPGMSRPPSAQPQMARMPPRDPSLEGLEEFSHLVMYDDAATAAAVAAENGVPPQNGTNGYPDMPPGPPSSAAELALRERELAIRQRELQIREQEMGMRRGPRRPPPPPRSTFDEEDEDDYFDPMDTLPIPSIDPDQVDMLSITSRRAKKSAPSASQLRKNPEITLNNGGGGGGASRPGSSFSRYFGGRKRTSDRIMQEIPGLHDSLMDNPMMAYASNRYGAVDRNHIQAGSRANSLTASRMGDYPPHPYPTSRRNSQSPATPPYGPPGPRMGRQGTSQDPSLGPPNGPRGGQPSPPGQMRAPVPRHPPGQGNAVGPQQIEQQYGVSNSSLAKGTPKHRSLTGSASASAESGDSGASANLDSETSAHSSQISLNGQQAATPVR